MLEVAEHRPSAHIVVGRDMFEASLESQKIVVTMATNRSRGGVQARVLGGVPNSNTSKIFH